MLGNAKYMLNVTVIFFLSKQSKSYIFQSNETHRFLLKTAKSNDNKITVSDLWPRPPSFYHHCSSPFLPLGKKLPVWEKLLAFLYCFTHSALQCRKDCRWLEDEQLKIETKKKDEGEGEKKIQVYGTGSKSPNSFFQDGVYQAEGVMAFLFSWHEAGMSSPLPIDEFPLSPC